MSPHSIAVRKVTFPFWSRARYQSVADRWKAQDTSSQRQKETHVPGLYFHTWMNGWFLLASVNVGQKSKRRDISSSNHCNILKEGGHGWHPCLQKQGREWDLATGDCETEASPGQPSFKKRLGRPRGILGRLSLEAMAAYHNVYQSLLLQWTSRS